MRRGAAPPIPEPRKYGRSRREPGLGEYEPDPYPTPGETRGAVTFRHTGAGRLIPYREPRSMEVWDPAVWAGKLLTR